MEASMRSDKGKREVVKKQIRDSKGRWIKVKVSSKPNSDGDKVSYATNDVAPVVSNTTHGDKNKNQQRSSEEESQIPLETAVWYLYKNVDGKDAMEMVSIDEESGGGVRNRKGESIAIKKQLRDSKGRWVKSHQSNLQLYKKEGLKVSCIPVVDCLDGISTNNVVVPISNVEGKKKIPSRIVNDK
ncbi:hypothetical protein GIB67_041561 [Kingdonia uniflora]|uniref:Uncharacterized protein n=1 Tax=Kingdonia uniflora TaxID=39325 RepID=A0A7J7MQM2_9MAGN|nr:hypothetical protein GIB67_041561 [Kingdonia uniflora]